MELSTKEKILIGVIGTVLIAAIGSSVWAFTSSKGTETTELDTESKEEKLDDALESSGGSGSSKDNVTTVNEDAGSSHKPDTAPQAISQPNSSSSPQGAQQRTDSSPKPAPTPSSEHTTPRQPVATCDDGMKVSYTNLRDSQVSAENARWTRQVNGFHEEAARRGGAHSGIAQAMINEARPIHDANLASIESNYQLNLRSINC